MTDSLSDILTKMKVRHSRLLAELNATNTDAYNDYRNAVIKRSWLEKVIGRLMADPDTASSRVLRQYERQLEKVISKLGRMVYKGRPRALIQVELDAVDRMLPLIRDEINASMERRYDELRDAEIKKILQNALPLLEQSTSKSMYLDLDNAQPIEAPPKAVEREMSHIAGVWYASKYLIASRSKELLITTISLLDKYLGPPELGLSVLPDGVVMEGDRYRVSADVYNEYWNPKIKLTAKQSRLVNATDKKLRGIVKKAATKTKLTDEIIENVLAALNGKRSMGDVLTADTTEATGGSGWEANYDLLRTHVQQTGAIPRTGALGEWVNTQLRAYMAGVLSKPQRLALRKIKGWSKETKTAITVHPVSISYTVVPADATATVVGTETPAAKTVISYETDPAVIETLSASPDHQYLGDYYRVMGGGYISVENASKVSTTPLETNIYVGKDFAAYKTPTKLTIAHYQHTNFMDWVGFEYQNYYGLLCPHSVKGVGLYIAKLHDILLAYPKFSYVSDLIRVHSTVSTERVTPDGVVELIDRLADTSPALAPYAGMLKQSAMVDLSSLGKALAGLFGDVQRYFQELYESRGISLAERFKVNPVELIYQGLVERYLADVTEEMNKYIAVSKYINDNIPGAPSDGYVVCFEDYRYDTMLTLPNVAQAFAKVNGAYGWLTLGSKEYHYLINKPSIYEQTPDRTPVVYSKFKAYLAPADSLAFSDGFKGFDG